MEEQQKQLWVITEHSLLAGVSAVRILILNWASSNDAEGKQKKALLQQQLTALISAIHRSVIDFPLLLATSAVANNCSRLLQFQTDIEGYPLEDSKVRGHYLFLLDQLERAVCEGIERVESRLYGSELQQLQIPAQQQQQQQQQHQAIPSLQYDLTAAQPASVQPTTPSTVRQRYSWNPETHASDHEQLQQLQELHNWQQLQLKRNSDSGLLSADSPANLAQTIQRKLSNMSQSAQLAAAQQQPMQQPLQQQQQSQQQLQSQVSNESTASKSRASDYDEALDELDHQFALKEACVDNAFKRAKQWADYVRVVCQAVEKMCAQSVEYHQRMGDNMAHLIQTLKSDSSNSLPLQSYYLTGASIIQQDCQSSEQIFRASIPQIVYEALRSRIKEHDNARKRFKNDWTATMRMWRKALNSMEHARQTYYQRCSDVERAHSDYVSTNTKTTNLVLVAAAPGQAGAGPTLRGDPKHEAKLERKKRFEEDCTAKREAAKKAYQRSVEELNSATEARERKKLEILRAVRDLIERGDQCFITATCGFFECYTRTKESNNQELRSLSKTSHQNYRPGSKYREFARTCINLDPDDPPPKFSFEEYNSSNRLSAPRKESHGGSPGDGSGCDNLDEGAIEDDEESGEAVDPAAASAMPAAQGAAKATGLRGIWSSTKDTAASFFNKPMSIKIKKPNSTGHLQLEARESGARSPRVDTQLHVSVICRCIQVIEETGITCRGIYRLPASKRRVMDLSAALEDRADVALYEESPYTVCGLMKYHLMQLPDALLSSELYSSFIEAGKEGADAARLTQLVAQLPKQSRLLAGILFHHLNRVSVNEADNHMDSLNLSLVFAPTVLKPKQESQINTASLTEVLDYTHQKVVTQALIEQACEIFGPASEYGVQELLPSPSHEDANSSESAQHSSSEFGSSEAQVGQSAALLLAAPRSGPRIPPAAFDPGVDFEDIDIEDHDVASAARKNKGGHVISGKDSNNSEQLQLEAAAAVQQRHRKRERAPGPPRQAQSLVQSDKDDKSSASVSAGVIVNSGDERKSMFV